MIGLLLLMITTVYFSFYCYKTYKLTKIDFGVRSVLVVRANKNQGPGTQGRSRRVDSPWLGQERKSLSVWHRPFLCVGKSWWSIAWTPAAKANRWKCLRHVSALADTCAAGFRCHSSCPLQNVRGKLVTHTWPLLLRKTSRGAQGTRGPMRAFIFLFNQDCHTCFYLKLTSISR